MNLGPMMILLGMLMMVMPLLNTAQFGVDRFGISNALRKVYRPREDTPADMLELLDKVPEPPGRD